MKETIKLSNPLTINGKLHNKLTYDTNEITASSPPAAPRAATLPALPSSTTGCTSTSASLPSSRSTPPSTSPTSSASRAPTS